MTPVERRRFYAEEVAAVAHLESPALVEAYARVPREVFLGPGPWLIPRGLDTERPYRETADADPAHIYHDVVVALDPGRGLNNGQPSSLARWIEALDARPGDALLHVGAGVGYYTAILAELVGPGGRVQAFEIDPDLAARARANLLPWPQVAVETGDASAPAGPFDAAFINAGVTHAPPEWLAAMRPGGRLVLPLTVHIPSIPKGVGVMLRLERSEGRWPARIVSQVAIYDCVNARDPERERALMALATPGAADRIRAVAVEPHERGAACLVHGDGFCLQS